MSARPDVGQARAAIQENPAGALAPVPLMQPTPSGPSLRLMQRKNSKDLAPDEQKRVLAKRQGNTLTKKTILKASLAAGEQNILEVQGVNDIRCPPCCSFPYCTNCPLHSIAQCAATGAWETRKLQPMLDLGVLFARGWFAYQHLHCQLSPAHAHAPDCMMRPSSCCAGGSRM